MERAKEGIDPPKPEFRNEKKTGAEICLSIFSGIVIGDRSSQRLVNFFSLSLVTVPEVFAKVNSSQFPLVSKVANCGAANEMQ